MEENSPHNKSFIKEEKGQLSIFLGITITVIVTMIAFIVNVGLFVKAKINLQNAVDAGAWSGAAVQARQLSNIAYMNWELRNTYKEWMFKYYVLGQMGLTDLRMANLPASGGLSFALKPFDTGSPTDPFNLPTTCIHFGSPNNICEIYDVPGIPRFPTVGLPGISERHETFLNSIRDIKSKDCSTRTIINQGTAILWAYGTGANVFPDAPEVGADRIGAWPEAMEIALRIRNLEAIVNRPPVPGAICRGQAGSLTGPCTGIIPLQQQFNSAPLNERPIKAFMAAYRNLGGGAFKKINVAADEAFDEFATSFTLTELSPNVASEADPNSLSGLLIPSDRNIDNVPALRKTFLDLQIYPVNYVTYFTSFFTKSGTIAGVTSEGECQGTKTALPVPGYITGFAKNTEVMTYYAVKGEAKFVGLFNPFTEVSNGGIVLKAYAAAKPFGGRIGPKLFGVSGGNAVIPREDDGLSRSAAFISGVEPPASFQHGAILPVQSTPDFWAKAPGDRIGGNPTSGSLVFGIPNMTYDFTNFGDLSTQVGSTSVGIIRPNNTPDPLGLYDAKQFRLLKANLVDVPPGDVLSSANISLSIEAARRPTRWDAINYLIPTPEGSGPDDARIDTQPIVNIQNSRGVEKYHLYAPLYDTNGELLYNNEADIIAQVTLFLDNNIDSFNSYIRALESAANTILSAGTGTAGVSGGASPGYVEAAQSIHPLSLDPSVTNFSSALTPPCPSMAHKFKFFYTMDNDTQGCNGEIKPIKQLLTEYFAVGGTGEGQQVYGDSFPFGQYYESSYAQVAPAGASAAPNPTNVELHTAYMPGSRTGATDRGEPSHPITGNTPFISKRNFYSTKLIPLTKVIQGGSFSFGGSTSLYQERDQLGYNPIPAEINSSNNFTNLILSSDVSEFGSASSLEF